MAKSPIDTLSDVVYRHNDDQIYVLHTREGPQMEVSET